MRNQQPRTKAQGPGNGRKPLSNGRSRGFPDSLSVPSFLFLILPPGSQFLVPALIACATYAQL